MELKDNAVEVCAAIVELDKSQQAKFEEIVKNKISDLGTELKQTDLTQYKIDVQGHDPIKQRYYHVSPKVKEKINNEIEEMLKKRNNRTFLFRLVEPNCHD